MRRIHIVFLVGIVIIFLLESTSAQYVISHSVLSSGVNEMSSSSYGLNGTVGQPGIGFIDSDEYRHYAGFWYLHQLLIPTSVDEITDMLPREYRLDQNYPNPFNPSTTIQFSLRERSKVSLVVYNILAQRVAVLVDNELDAGEYRFLFNASSLPSGVYIYRLAAGEFVQQRSMVFTK